MIGMLMRMELSYKTPPQVENYKLLWDRICLLIGEIPDRLSTQPNYMNKAKWVQQTVHILYMCVNLCVLICVCVHLCVYAKIKNPWIWEEMGREERKVFIRNLIFKHVILKN